jgi:TnpA family transposase
MVNQILNQGEQMNNLNIQTISYKIGEHHTNSTNARELYEALEIMIKSNL